MRRLRLQPAQEAASAGTEILEAAQNSAGVNTHPQKIPTLSQLPPLCDLGVSKEYRRVFFEGEKAPLLQPTLGGQHTFGFVEFTGTRLRSGIVSVVDKSGNVLKAFTQFRSASRKLTRNLGTQELELYGAQLQNPKLKAILENQGFIPAANTIPDFLGGGPPGILTKTFPVK